MCDSHRPAGPSTTSTAEWSSGRSAGVGLRGIVVDNHPDVPPSIWKNHGTWWKYISRIIGDEYGFMIIYDRITIRLVSLLSFSCSFFASAIIIIDIAMINQWIKYDPGSILVNNIIYRSTSNWIMWCQPRIEQKNLWKPSLLGACIYLYLYPPVSSVPAEKSTTWWLGIPHDMTNYLQMKHRQMGRFPERHVGRVHPAQAT